MAKYLESAIETIIREERRRAGNFDPMSYDDGLAFKIYHFILRYTEPSWFDAKHDLPADGQPVWGRNGANTGEFIYIYSGGGEWYQVNKEAEPFTPVEWMPLPYSDKTKEGPSGESITKEQWKSLTQSAHALRDLDIKRAEVGEALTSFKWSTFGCMMARMCEGADKIRVDKMEVLDAVEMIQHAEKVKKSMDDLQQRLTNVIKTKG